MIKFFSKIRQRLLSESKFSKYLLYAIGEIILVVIGILIALQINNWNSERLEDNRAEEFVRKVQIQIDKNLVRVSQHSDQIHNRYMQSLALVSIIGSGDTANVDSKIDSLVNLNWNDYHLNLNMNTVLEGRENGDFAFISSEELRQHLYGLITLNDKIIERERVANEDLNILFVPYLNKHYNSRNSSISEIIDRIGESKIYKGDNHKMLLDQEFENYIMSRMYYNVGNREIYNEIKKKLEVINSIIENTLKQ